MPCGQFTLCRACGDETACVAARYLTLRIVRERHERKNPLPFSFSQRSPVSGLHQIILGKGRKSEGGNHWCLPSCAPAGEAGFSRFASENPNFWNDNENPLKRRTIAPANSACSLSGLAKTLVHAILTRNTKRKPRTYLPSVSKSFKPAEKKSRAFAQLLKNLL